VAFSQEEPPEPERISPEQLSRWVSELDSDEFIVREKAMKNLLDAGALAIEPLGKLLPEASLEVAARGVHVLSELALSDHIEDSETARGVLEQLAKVDNEGVVGNAKAALRSLNELRRGRAVAELQELGAQVHQTFQTINFARTEKVYRIEIGEDWKGENADLRRLAWIGDIPQLMLNSPRITDDGLKYLAGLEGVMILHIKRAKINDQSMAPLKSMKKLQQLAIYYTPITDASVQHLAGLTGAIDIKLFGTNITNEGAAKLQAALPTTKIDHRRGAFLGVGCQAHDLGCEIVVVHPKSAAQEADIRTGDVIVTYEKQPVKDFENLTHLISKNAALEKVTLEIRRGDETLSKVIKLGEWE